MRMNSYSVVAANAKDLEQAFAASSVAVLYTTQPPTEIEGDGLSTAFHFRDLKDAVEVLPFVVNFDY